MNNNLYLKNPSVSLSTNFISNWRLHLTLKKIFLKILTIKVFNIHTMWSELTKEILLKISRAAFLKENNFYEKYVTANDLFCFGKFKNILLKNCQFIIVFLSDCKVEAFVLDDFDRLFLYSMILIVIIKYGSLVNFCIHT